MPLIPDSREIERAAVYAAGGGMVLKATQMLLRFLHRRGLTAEAELEAARRIGAEVREELRKDVETYRTRLAAAEARIEALELEVSGLREELREAQEARAEAEEKQADAEAELRIFRRKLQSPTPVPPSRPPEGSG